jgi:hypothetical protein
MQFINNFVNRFGSEGTPEKFGSVKSLNPTTYSNAKTDVTHSKLKHKEIVRVIAATLSFGISELGVNAVKFAIGSSLTSCGNYNKKMRAQDIESFETNIKRNYPNTFLNDMVEKISIKTIDGENLDGMILKAPCSNNPKKTEIWLNGQGQSYESRLIDAMEYSEKTGNHILLFNYRGCGDSTGTPMSANDFVRDALAMVDFLTTRDDNPLPPENLVIHGYSMGGAVGAKTTSVLNNSNIQHQNDRSLAVFSRAAQDAVTDKTGSTILGSVVGGAIKYSGFEINAKKLYVNKDGSLTDLVNQTEIKYLPKGNDKTISEENSLHHQISRNPESKKYNIKAEELSLVDTRGNQKMIALKCSGISRKYNAVYTDDHGKSIKIVNFREFYNFSKKTPNFVIEPESNTSSDSFEFQAIAELNPLMVNHYRFYVLKQLDKIAKIELDPQKLNVLKKQIQELNRIKVVDPKEANQHTKPVNSFVLKSAKKTHDYTQKLVLNTTAQESFEDFFGYS